MASTSSGNNENLFKMPEITSKQQLPSYSSVVKSNTTSNNIPTIKITENVKSPNTQQIQHKLPKINDPGFKNLWKNKVINIQCAVAFEVKENFKQLDYLDAIARKTDPAHVFSICRANNKMTIYFTSEQIASEFIREGIEINSIHIPGLPLKTKTTRVVVSNVDPIIDDKDILNYLKRYGKPTADWMRPIPINSGGNSKYTHIISHRREVYMESLHTQIPERAFVQSSNGFKAPIFFAVEGQIPQAMKSVQLRIAKCTICNGPGHEETDCPNLLSSITNNTGSGHEEEPETVENITGSAHQEEPRTVEITEEDGKVIQTATVFIIDQQEFMETEETSSANSNVILNNLNDSMSENLLIESREKNPEKPPKNLGAIKRVFNALDTSPNSTETAQASKIIKQEMLEKATKELNSDSEWDSDDSVVSSFSQSTNDFTTAAIIKFLEKVKSKRSDVVRKHIIKSFTSDFKQLAQALEEFRRQAHNIENLPGRANDWVQRAKRAEEFIQANMLSK